MCNEIFFSEIDFLKGNEIWMHEKLPPFLNWQHHKLHHSWLVGHHKLRHSWLVRHHKLHPFLMKMINNAGLFTIRKVINCYIVKSFNKVLIIFDEINLRDDSTLVSKVSRQIFKTRGKNKQCHGTVALSEFAALDINYHGEYKTKKFNEIFVNIPFCATIPLSSSM